MVPLEILNTLAFQILAQGYATPSGRGLWSQKDLSSNPSLAICYKTLGSALEVIYTYFFICKLGMIKMSSQQDYPHIISM